MPVTRFAPLPTGFLWERLHDKAFARGRGLARALAFPSFAAGDRAMAANFVVSTTHYAVFLCLCLGFVSVGAVLGSTANRANRRSASLR